MKTDSFAYHVTRYFSDYLPNQTAASPNTIHSYRDTFVQLLNFFKKKHVLRKNSGFLILHLKMWKNFCAGLKRKGESAPLQETSGLLHFSALSADCKAVLSALSSRRSVKGSAYVPLIRDTSISCPYAPYRLYALNGMVV